MSFAMKLAIIFPRSAQSVVLVRVDVSVEELHKAGMVICEGARDVQQRGKAEGKRSLVVESRQTVDLDSVQRVLLLMLRYSVDLASKERKTR